MSQLLVFKSLLNYNKSLSTHALLATHHTAARFGFHAYAREECIWIRQNCAAEKSCVRVRVNYSAVCLHLEVIGKGQLIRACLDVLLYGSQTQLIL